MSSLDRDYNEKRSFMRMQLEAPATLTLPDGSQKHCICKDLSAIGMQLEVDEMYEEDTELGIHIPAFSHHFSALDAQVRVTRCIKEANNRYALGVVVEQMS